MKTILSVFISSVFFLFLLLNSVEAVHPHISYVTTPTWMVPADPAKYAVPQVNFIRHFKYTYTPHGGEETTVNALDLNGRDLFLTNSDRTIRTIPVIKLGGTNGVNLTVLEQSFLSGDQKRVIVQLPEVYLSGNHKVWVGAYTNSIIAIWTIATILPEPIQLATKSVILFSGAVDAIPSGWQMCDGTNSTPNLKNKFIVGAGNTYAVGATGGRKTIAGHALTVPQLPRISFTIPFGDARNNAGSSTGSPTGLINSRTTRTNSLGSGQAHSHGDNRPPYHALSYICKN